MKIKFLFSMAMAATLLAACSNEDQWGDSTPLQEGQLRATMEGTNPATRVGFAESGDFYWSNTDALGVQTVPAAGADNTENSTFGKFTLSSGGGTASAVFTGSGTAATYAVYPYREEHSISGSSLTFHFRATYDKLTKVDQDFFTTTQGEGNSFNTAMWGTITGQSVTMKHLGGVFCIKFDEMPYESGTLTLSVANKRINGDYTVTLEDDVEIQAVDITTSTTETEGVAENEVQIPFANATVNQPGVFYVPVPTGSYQSVRVSLTDGSNETSTVVGDYTITRKRAVPLELEASSLTGESERNESLSDASTALTNTDTKTVTVSGEVTAEHTEVTVFSETASETPATKTLVLENVASGASLTIKDPTADQSTTSTVTNEFTLSIPYSETAEGETTYDPLDLTVNMPNTTVTLAGNGGKATYGEVTASTAENTLIVSAGVSINKLTVMKGNIRLQGDAAISEIVNSKGSDAKLYIYVEGAGYELPGNLGDNIEVVDASVDDLKAVAAKGGEYTLQSDITLSEPLVVAGEMTLDLNGHALKASEAGLTKILNTSDAVVLVRRGAKLTINDSSNGQGSIDYNGTETVSVAVKVTDSNDESDTNIQNQPAELIVNGGTLRGYWYGISGNGTRHNTSITVNGGTIRGSLGTGIYHPQDGTLTITDGVVTGLNAAVELRSGTLNVSGGTFGSTATEFETTSNGSGTTISGAAIAISQHTTNKAINVTISGGILNGIYALYEEDLQDESVTQITVSAGSNAVFNGKVYSENCAEFISGGTFTDPSALAYLSENANVKMVLSDNLTLEQSIVIEKGTVTVDLQEHTLTAESTATINVSDKNRITAIAVRDGASVTIQNGQIGNDTDALFYGIYAYGSAQITLTDINFGEKVTYAYNGAGDLTASGCTFKGWLSGWSQGGAEFTDCTFTIGKAYYPAAICYGSTEFTNCKFFNNNTDADVYDDGGAPDSDGYYCCNYVVAAYNSGTTIDFNSCKFIDASGAETNITTESHPYHGCGWGDGTVPPSQIKVNGNVVTGQCSDLQKAQEAGGTTEE